MLANHDRSLGDAPMDGFAAYRASQCAMKCSTLSRSVDGLRHQERFSDDCPVVMVIALLCLFYWIDTRLVFGLACCGGPAEGIR
jgi:hypothetical protein